MILNLMFGGGRGGLEQAALDHAEALRMAGMEALSLTRPDAWINGALAAQGLAMAHLRPRGGWDVLAAHRLRRTATAQGARAAICHGNRALSLGLRALGGRIPVIAVAHNYQTRRFVRADACFAVTQHGADALAARGVRPARIHVIPNAVRIPAQAAQTAQTTQAGRADFRRPPVIGAMGRFVAKKGFDTFITALGLLAARDVDFRAVLAGDGAERAALQAQAAAFGLSERIALPGWADDKTAFFNDIDIFALPSLHEPFGIVLLEAMAHGLPVVAADAEGPREIVRPGINGLIVPRGDAPALADALETMLNDPGAAQRMGAAARTRAEQTYGLPALAARLSAALDAIL